jgi:peroxiredoxin Q/BCP
MRRLAAFCVLATAMALGAPGVSEAQEPSGFLSVGQDAPDIQVMGATRYGVLSEPVKLSQFRGETVVLAFFFRARTGG